MRLPNNHLAVIAQSKLVDYILNPAHPDNGGKAECFLVLGFTLANWEQLAAALRRLAVETEATDLVESPYGTKYVLDGWLIGQENGRVMVRTVWIVDIGAHFPRLVTAYPI